MKSKLLLPRQFRIIGGIVFIFGLLAFFLVYSSSSYYNDITTINKFSDIGNVISAYSGCGPAIIMGLMLVAFSKEKVEDEQIIQLRLDSLQWAIYINYFLIAMCFFIIDGIGILPVILLNILTPIIFFIIRFRWKIYQNNCLLKKEDLA